jgi:hypothetical protein
VLRDTELAKVSLVSIQKSINLLLEQQESQGKILQQILSLVQPPAVASLDLEIGKPIPK